MKKLLFLVVILLVSCNRENQYQRLNSFLNFESDLIQQFSFPPDSIINIQGNKGTKITFKLEDLEGILNGPKIKDSIQVRLLEFTTKQDLLLANAQTTSDGKWLISDGAFKIEILVNGEALSLKDGKEISIQLPKTSDAQNMQLFYGERDALGNMDWNNSGLNLKEKKYQSLYYSLQSIIDEELPLPDVSETYDEPPYGIESLGLLSLNEYQTIYPKIDSVYITNDTLSNLKTWKNYEDFLANRAQSELIEQDFYETIKISRLGWINIDKFAPDEETVDITFDSDKSFDALKTYIVDLKNNTILSISENKITIPKDRSFLIISFAIEDNEFFGYKKSIRFKTSKKHIIKLKKIKKSQLKSLLDLSNITS